MEKKARNRSHLSGRAAEPRERKPRPAPAFDAAKKVVAKVAAEAEGRYWKPLRTRRALAAARKRSRVSAGPWRRAVRAVFGAGVLELPDYRQLSLPGCP